MFILLFITLVATVFAPDAELIEPPIGAGATATISKEDFCRLIGLAVRKNYAEPPRQATLLSQPCTKELAGEKGRIWMHAVARKDGQATYPLARGESCDGVLAEVCDRTRTGNPCSFDRRSREGWRVGVFLTVIDVDHVDTMATLEKPSRQHKRYRTATLSPVPPVFGHFVRAKGEWRPVETAEIERRPTKDKTQVSKPDAGQPSD